MSLRSAVFDTNILIDYSRDIDVAVQAVQNCPQRLISKVTWVEFLTGIPAGEETPYRAFLEANFSVITPDEGIFDISLELRRAQGLRLPDALIYATAKDYNLPLVTRDAKDFDAAASDIHIPY